MGKAHFKVNMVIINTVRLVKIKIATGRKVQANNMMALIVLRRSYPLHIAVVSWSWNFLFFLRSSTASFRL